MKPLNSRKAALARLLAPVWWILGCCFRRTHITHPPASILIFDFHLIGDIVILTPLLRALRQAYPDAYIALVSGPWAKEILCGTTWVDEIISFTAPWVKYHQGWRGWSRCLDLVLLLRRKKWDLGIEVRGDVRQILLLALAGARRRVGYVFSGGGPLLTDIVPDDGLLAHLADHHRRIAEYLGIWPSAQEYLPELKLTNEEIIYSHQMGTYCGFHFGASLPLRRLPSKEAIKLICYATKRKYLPILLFISPDAPDSSQEIFDALPAQLQSRTELWKGDLRTLIVALSRADRIYCMDSGPAHIAAALGVPVTVIYGPAISTYVKPIGKDVTIVEKKVLNCKPCDQKNCKNEINLYCMKDLVETMEIR